MFFGSLALFAQRIPHYQLALDLLLHHRQYIELEHDLKAAQDLSASDRAFYNGILANRKNDVSGSAKLTLIRPLVHATFIWVPMQSWTKGHSWLHHGVYGIAPGVSVARLTSRNHFPIGRGCRQQLAI
jgi:hypothetical protein